MREGPSSDHHGVVCCNSSCCWCRARGSCVGKTVICPSRLVGKTDCLPNNKVSATVSQGLSHKRLAHSSRHSHKPLAASVVVVSEARPEQHTAPLQLCCRMLPCNAVSAVSHLRTHQSCWCPLPPPTPTRHHQQVQSPTGHHEWMWLASHAPAHGMTCRVRWVTQKLPPSPPVITPQVQKVRQLLRAKGRLTA